MRQKRFASAASKNQRPKLLAEVRSARCGRRPVNGRGRMKQDAQAKNGAGREIETSTESALSMLPSSCHASKFIDDPHHPIRRNVKRLIVDAALFQLIPWCLAEHLIRRAGLRHE